MNRAVRSYEVDSVTRSNGRQEKSYVNTDDCIHAIWHAIQQAEEVNLNRSMYTYNIGTRTMTSVDPIAEIVADVLGVDPELEYTGVTVDGWETCHKCGPPLKNWQDLDERQSMKVQLRFSEQHSNWPKKYE